jgi:hypothetical protein
MPASGVQLLAMAVLLYGTAIYNQSVEIPAILGGGGGLSSPKTSALYASPALTRSPFLSRTIQAREGATSNVNVDIQLRPSTATKRQPAEV